ncbi:MAG: undecaprenyl diphosphate synthase family protein [Methanosarcinaceae archaeon]|nr:undecaprenyl diphosphate synthase family protein [Methanosarcinaceae archaeon]
MNIINTLYERYLSAQIAKVPTGIPKHVTLVLAESDLLNPDGISKLRSFIAWCKKLEINIISIHIDILDVEPNMKNEMVMNLIDQLQTVFSKLPNDIGFEIYGEHGNLKDKHEGSSPLVYLFVGFRGRDEITKAVRSLLLDVKSGKIAPDAIDESVIESHLMIRHEPDIVIRAGGKHLSDFLIWQSVYSELYFTDVNWSNVRKIDILRIIRDFQKRQRRFGK